MVADGILDISSHRFEVIQSIEGCVGENIPTLLKPVEECWQPSDYLPDPTHENFHDQLTLLRENAKSLPDSILVVLVGDMVTEEALPSYQTWLNRLKGVGDDTGVSQRPWAQWSRGWTAEENRHGDLLNRYLYLTGRVDMRSVETTIHHLLSEGFDPRTENDPYLGFIYTSFQERATKISHRNLGVLAKRAGEENLHTICGMIAGDEARHETAYKFFMTKVFEADPSGALQSFETMMRRKIVMPAYMMNDGNDKSLFLKFSHVAQKIGVYTAQDYASIIQELVNHWKVESMHGLSNAAEKAQEYLCTLAERYQKLAERALASGTHKFSWVYGREVG